MNGIMHGFLNLACYRELQHYLTFATSPCDNIPGQTGCLLSLEPCGIDVGVAINNIICLKLPSCSKSLSSAETSAGHGTILVTRAI
jgi:hypothetical protein